MIIEFDISEVEYNYSTQMYNVHSSKISKLYECDKAFVKTEDEIFFLKSRDIYESLNFFNKEQKPEYFL